MRRLLFVGVLSLAMGFFATADAGGQDYVLSCSDGSGQVGDDVTVTVTMDIDAAADGINGFQFAICHDPDLLDIDVTTDIAGLTLLTDLNDGDGPGFEDFSETAAGDGWQVGALVDLMDPDTVIAPEGGAFYDVTYELLDIGTADLSFCDGDLTAPEVGVGVNSVTTAASEAFECSTAGGEIQVLGPWSMTVSDATGNYDILTGEGGDVVVTVSIEEDDGNVGAPNDTDAFQFGIGHDDTYLDPTAAVEIGVLADFDGGDGPAFFNANLNADNGPGITVGVLYELGAQTLTIDFDGGGEAVVEITYELVADNLIDEEGPIEVTLDLSDDLGEPLVPTRVIVDGDETIVNQFDGTVTLSAGDDALFKRGDIDGNDVVFALIDALYVLAWAFTGGPAPPCLDAADVDGNNTVFALIDALYILAWAFTGGTAPPDPGTAECGPDNDDDGDSPDCETPPACA